jgi:two-component system nitrogen regulation sensor histidine kinase GlnL
LDIDDPLVRELEVSRDALVAEELSRLRPTPQIKAIAERLGHLESAVAVGIRTPERLEGLLLLGPKLSGHIYSAIEINALPILCDQLAVALENAELYTQTRDDKIYNEVLLDSLTSGVVAVNIDGLITVLNREAQRITGLQARSLLEQPFSQLPAALAEALETTLSTGRIIRDQDALLESDDEEPVPIRLGSSSFSSHTGALLGVLVVFTDLTTVKKLENQVRRTDRLASIGTLAAGMAHEIKNPLVTVKTFTQLLPERYQDEDFRGTFSTLIGQEVRRIDDIVNQLLEFARPAKPDLAPIGLHTVVGKCLRLLEQQMRQRNLELRKEFTEESDAILGDANLLQQAFVNFLLNAIDSMQEGGALTVSTSHLRFDRRARAKYGEHSDDRRIRLSIRDTGVGIAPEKLPHIFDPFFTTKSHGTGLGLSVSHGIIQDHGGDIEVESQPGQGTVFHIVFPVRTAEVPA